MKMISKICKSTIYCSLVLIISLYARSTFAAQENGKTLTVILDQTNPSSPTVISVVLENNNPERYLLLLENNYRTVQEIDETGKILYKGRVKNTTVMFRNPNITPARHPQMVEVPQNPFTINFPYFTESRKVRIFDESDTMILEIDLGQYNLGATPTPAPRFADCNKCGYCKKEKKQPGDLKQCMQCLYPDFVNNPDGTLAVDPIKNIPVQPKTGTYYSQLGCIDVGIAGFRDPTAAGGVLNIILTRLLFPITGVLSILALIYGAFLVMTAQDDAEQIARGKKWIYGAIVGVIFTFGAILLIQMIGGDILKIPGLGV